MDLRHDVSSSAEAAMANEATDCGACEGIKDCGDCDCLAGQHLELKATAVVDVQVTVVKAAVRANNDWLESMLRLVTGLVGS